VTRGQLPQRAGSLGLNRGGTNHSLLLCCDWSSRHPTLTSKNRYPRPPFGLPYQPLPHMGHMRQQLSVVTAFRLTGLASMVSRRIFTHNTSVVSIIANQNHNPQTTFHVLSLMETIYCLPSFTNESAASTTQKHDDTSDTLTASVSPWWAETISRATSKRLNSDALCLIQEASTMLTDRQMDSYSHLSHGEERA